MADENKQKSLKVNYRLAAADDLGLIKIIESPGGSEWKLSKVVKTWGKPDRERSVEFIKYYQGSELLISRRDGQVQIMDSKTGIVSGVISPGKGRKVDKYATSLESFEQQVNGIQKQFVVTGWVDGNVQIYSANKGICGKRKNVESEEETNKWEMVSVIEAKHKLECMEISRNKTHLALGCEGQELSVWDLENKEKVYQAKGSKPDWLGLMDKPWVTCCAWRPHDEQNSQIVIGTGIRKVKLYDYKRQKRPVQQMQFGEARITQVESEPDGNYVWVSNATGHVYRWDIRRNVQDGGLKGIGGSIRAMRLNPFTEQSQDGESMKEEEEDYDDKQCEQELQLASVGLDRWCRIHDATSRKLLAKVYLKQQLTGCAWLPVSKGETFEHEQPSTEQINEEVPNPNRPPKRTKSA